MPYGTNAPICSVEGCTRKVVARGCCDPHYRHLKAYGDPLAGPFKPRGSLADRTWAKVDKNGPVPTLRPDLGPCWIWTGKKDKKGYGWIRIGGAGTPKAPAHRVTYELTAGEIPSGLELDHLCRVHDCVNPTHLEPVTHQENMLRGETFAAANAQKTHCPKGHPYDEQNTRVRSNGKRSCRTCDDATRRKQAP